MIYFILGIILGVLIRDIKYKTIEKVEEVKKYWENTETAQFFEPITDKEKWDGAKNVDDLLNK